MSETNDILRCVNSNVKLRLKSKVLLEKYLYSSYVCVPVLVKILCFSFAHLGDGDNCWTTEKCQGVPLPPPLDRTGVLHQPYITPANSPILHRPYITQPYITPALY